MNKTQMLEARARSIAWAKHMTSMTGAVYLDTETTGLGDDAAICDIAVCCRTADGDDLITALACDAAGGDFGIDAASPAAPGNEPPDCMDEGIGWGPVTCGATPRIKTSWGQVKSLFSDINER